MPKASQAISSIPDTLTTSSFQQALPKGVSLRVTQELVDHINGLLQDPILQQNFGENLLSYSSVLREGKFKADQYVAAVEYVSRKLLGDSNEVAYSKVFPVRYAKLLTDNRSNTEISAYVAAYHASKLVGLIMAQSLTPAWIHNQKAYQDAINVQVQLMKDDSVSPKVRSDAANSILTHLKQPESAKIELDIRTHEDSSLVELQATMREFALQQQKAIQDGHVKVQSVAGSRILPKDTDIVVDSN